MSEHTKEPWFTVETECDVIEITNADRNGLVVPIAKVSTGYVNQVGIEQEANARRIVACVNALRGVSTDHLEQYGLPDFAQKISDLIQQRDKLLAALVEVIQISDRDHDAWNHAKATIAEVKGQS